MKSYSLRDLSAVVCAALAVFAAGCGTTTNTTERAQPVGERDMVSDKRVSTDSRLSIRAQLVGVNQANTPGGLLKVQAELLNTTHTARNVLYRFEWFDEQGMQMTTATSGSWIPLYLEGKESKFINGIAPSAACRDFRLKLIRP
ncbi:MAG: YcfL family protein [Verrucomicrobia bacterium]|nr:YcfL family protein [Verrucomicrobiota bacterium]MBI3869678.1 YcfL family protein [Verrucomicrobiota bacterium]